MCAIVLVEYLSTDITASWDQIQARRERIRQQITIMRTSDRTMASS